MKGKISAEKCVLTCVWILCSFFGWSCRHGDSADSGNAPRFTRVFNWGIPANEEIIRKYAQAGVTDIRVFNRKQLDLVVKYGMTPYAGITFSPAGPHFQVMSPEEQAYNDYIRGADLDAKMPGSEKKRIIERRKAEKGNRFGGESDAHPDTLAYPIRCFISDKDLVLTKRKLDNLLEKAVPGVKGVFMDFIGYVNFHGCRCSSCLDAYKAYIREHRLPDNEAARNRFYLEKLIEYYNAAIDYVKSKRPDFKIAVHCYPDFRPEHLLGNRTKADFCGQTVAWYFRWPDEKIAAYTRYVVRHAKDYFPHVEGVPFLGLCTRKDTILADKTPEDVERELQIILAAGGRTLMVCDGDAMIKPGFFEVFRKYCGK